MTVPRIVLALACLAAGTVAAQTDDALRETVRQALDNQPDITARLNALKASEDAVDIARAPLRPRVGLEADLRRTEDRITTRNPEGQRLNQTGVSLVLNQLIWDGLATSKDVGRLRREQRARWFELAEQSEQTALEAVRAHLDVLRYRRLVELAEDNYVQHRFAYGQLASRNRAGVDPGVDLEQAAARLALAESNLTTETANLHDVTARYQRIVGRAPAASLGAARLETANMPPTPHDALALALRESPAVSASIETLRAARAALAVRESAYQPRVEARVRAGTGRNFDGVPDQKRDTTAELTFTWNLYNGGADQARVRQGANLLNQAADLRDRTCRDVRQTTSIAWNDVRKLGELVPTLDRNTISIEKARDAYLQQFNIGRRSLLDLLNAENELYTARRAFANAQFDQTLAGARLLASLQRLTRDLGLAPPATLPAADEADADDAPLRCPPEPVLVPARPRAELDARANELIKTAPPAQPASVR